MSTTFYIRIPKQSRYGKFNVTETTAPLAQYSNLQGPYYAGGEYEVVTLALESEAAKEEWMDIKRQQMLAMNAWPRVPCHKVIFECRQKLALLEGKPTCPFEEEYWIDERGYEHSRVRQDLPDEELIRLTPQERVARGIAYLRYQHGVKWYWSVESPMADARRIDSSLSRGPYSIGGFGHMIESPNNLHYASCGFTSSDLYDENCGGHTLLDAWNTVIAAILDSDPQNDRDYVVYFTKDANGQWTLDQERMDARNTRRWGPNLEILP